MSFSLPLSPRPTSSPVLRLALRPSPSLPRSQVALAFAAPFAHLPPSHERLTLSLSLALWLPPPASHWHHDLWRPSLPNQLRSSRCTKELEARVAKLKEKKQELQKKQISYAPNIRTPCNVIGTQECSTMKCPYGPNIMTPYNVIGSEESSLMKEPQVEQYLQSSTQRHMLLVHSATTKNYFDVASNYVMLDHLQRTSFFEQPLQGSGNTSFSNNFKGSEAATFSSEIQRGEFAQHALYQQFP